MFRAMSQLKIKTITITKMTTIGGAAWVRD